MAAPATHIIFAEALLQTAPQFAADEFIVGTSFPDIRYLGSIAREQTHVQPATLDLVRQEIDSFRAGAIFHNYIDITRNNYWQQSDVYQHLPHSPHLQRVLKFYEDVVLYRHVSEWPQIVTYFGNILPGEQTFGLPDSEIAQWHQIISEYIQQQPTVDTALTFMSHLKFPHDPQTIQDLRQLAEHITATNGIETAVEGLYHALANGITQHA